MGLKAGMLIIKINLAVSSVKLCVICLEYVNMFRIVVFFTFLSDKINVPMFFSKPGTSSTFTFPWPKTALHVVLSVFLLFFVTLGYIRHGQHVSENYNIWVSISPSSPTVQNPYVLSRDCFRVSTGN